MANDESVGGVAVGGESNAAEITAFALLQKLEARVAALEARAGLAPGVKTFDSQGYQTASVDYLLPFMRGTSDVARAFAKHAFDVTVGGRTVTPLDPDYHAAYVLAGRFPDVQRSVQKAWLEAIFRDAMMQPAQFPAWYRGEFAV